MGGRKAKLAIQDPPYNLVAFETRSVEQFICWCSQWIQTTSTSLDTDSALYVWLGADQDEGFQPLPFMLMMGQFKEFVSRSLITMRNQRGYGTQKNWMAVRQECLYYVKGHPNFVVQYTDIPKILEKPYLTRRVVKHCQTSGNCESRAWPVRGGGWFRFERDNCRCRRGSRRRSHSTSPAEIDLCHGAPENRPVGGDSKPASGDGLVVSSTHWGLRGVKRAD